MSTNHAKCALIMPEPYRGTLPRKGTPNENWSIIEAATYFDLPPLFVRRGVWVVCRDGIYCLHSNYYIAKERFDESNWIEHVTEKNWVDENDFASIFEIAKTMVELEII
ncbi:hypothetical protein [Allochromatium vinosum]|uniref:hypothetical protein n=1 Tax=Allochromatium vinosum TaxID=1049 RepID=UPI001CBE0C51|nr:hypothetical protein [Allochromatium vinosum]